MKRKTSQKALSSQTLSARLEAWKRSDLSSLSLCFLGRFSSIACACSLIVFTLIALSLVFIIFVFFLVTWLNS